MLVVLDVGDTDVVGLGDDTQALEVVFAGLVIQYLEKSTPLLWSHQTALDTSCAVLPCFFACAITSAKVITIIFY